MTFTYAELAKEAEREVALREWVYPHRVAAGKMMQQAADRQLAMMRVIAAHFRALAAADDAKDRLL